MSFHDYLYVVLVIDSIIILVMMNPLSSLSHAPPPGLSIPAAVVGRHLFVVADGVWERHPEAPHGPQSLLQLSHLDGGERKLWL